VRGERLVALRRDRWARYGTLLDRVQSAGLPTLAPGEVREFARLYRETAADLARLRTEGVEAEIEQYVERLVAGGHNVLYRASGEGIEAGGLARFLLRGFPARVRQSGPAIATAASVWLLGAVLAFAVAVLRPDLARDLCPQKYLDRAEVAAAARIRGETAGYVEMDATFTPLWSSKIVANNVQATFVVFAFGVTAGVGTVLLLFLNGALFGAVAGAFAAEGVASVFWTFVAAHGPVEIPAFLVAGAAGLRMGGALLRPVASSRGEAFVREAMDAAGLLGGTTVLLGVAALVEAFVSPSSLPPVAKAAVGLGCGGAALAWILLAGRGAEAAGQPDLPSIGEGPASVMGRRRV
jgi:uncharacterized membrane protein SpoIIM required for sporulation